MLSRQVDMSQIEDKIMSWLKRKMTDAENLSISNMERSGSGLSNESFLFDLDWKEAGESKSEGMVLRWAPQKYPVHPVYDIGMQYKIMQRLSGTGVPVPRMYWLEEDESLLGSAFYLMGKVKGFVPPDNPSYHTFGSYHDASPEQRTKMWWGAVEAMANVHMLDWKKKGIDHTIGVPGNPDDPIGFHLDYYLNFLNWAKAYPEEKAPILEATLDWLRKNLYEPDRVKLCWGDARLGNVMYDDALNVVAVLDWELAYLGDPESDLAWFILLDWTHSTGGGTPRLEGTPDREETVAFYEKVTGWKVKHLLYNEVFGAFKFGVMLHKIYKNFKHIGIIPQDSPVELNNVCTQLLARLLDLPSPGEAPRQKKEVKDINAVVQLNLTGPHGSTWHIIADKGRGSLHKGAAEKPDITATISAEDWDAIQSGKMARIHAWTGGRLKVDGDEGVYRQLENMISELWKG